MLNGSFEGVVESGKWTRYTDEEQNRAIAILNLVVKIGEETVFPSLFFDRELVPQGLDAGKERMRVSLETLKSYGIECDPENYTKNRPASFIEQLQGKTVNVYCNEKDKKQRAFLNKKSRPELKADEIDQLWGELATGEAPANKDEKAEKNEDLVF